MRVSVHYVQDLYEVGTTERMAKMAVSEAREKLPETVELFRREAVGVIQTEPVDGPNIVGRPVLPSETTGAARSET